MHFSKEQTIKPLRWSGIKTKQKVQRLQKLILICKLNEEHRIFQTFTVYQRIKWQTQQLNDNNYYVYEICKCKTYGIWKQIKSIDLSICHWINWEAIKSIKYYNKIEYVVAKSASMILTFMLKAMLKLTINHCLAHSTHGSFSDLLQTMNLIHSIMFYIIILTVQTCCGKYFVSFCSVFAFKFSATHTHTHNWIFSHKQYNKIVYPLRGLQKSHFTPNHTYTRVLARALAHKNLINLGLLSLQFQLFTIFHSPFNCLKQRVIILSFWSVRFQCYKFPRSF